MEIRDCFVIMPFSDSVTNTKDEWIEIFNEFFVPAWESFEVECHRTSVSRGSITKDIIERLFSGSIVLADLTDSNPNVMYELGVRHAFKKPSIMVKQKGTSIPFDVNDYNVFEYEFTPPGLRLFKTHIENVIEDVKKYPNKGDNPVWDFLNTESFTLGYYTIKQNILKLETLKEELVGNKEKCDIILGEIDKLGGSMSFTFFGSSISALGDAPRVYDSPVQSTPLQIYLERFFKNIQMDAMNHLRITRYVDFPEDDYTILNRINSYYQWCNFYSKNPITYVEGNEDQRINIMKDLIDRAVDIIDERISELEKT
jgi:hypothetical protein